MRYVVEDGKRYVIREGKRIEVDTLEVDSPELQKRQRVKREAFVMLPYERTMAAANLGGATLVVLVELAYRKFRTKSNSVPLTNSALRAVGISRKAKLLALRQLEELGMVEVSWRGERRSPLVTILWE